MKKDVIYIDIEDDITAIIEKVKGAKAPIVALVPPKRVGVLQSTVNLKLLQRAAATANKRVVLITNDQALMGLAAGIALPVAKNLQSKPEIAAITALDTDDDDVINGEELPVGDLAKTAPIADELADIELDGTDKDKPSTPDPKKTKKSTGTKIPNFDRFRKRLFIIGGIGVVLVGLLIWGIFFVGEAKIAITAKTNIVNISKTLQLKENATPDATQGVVSSVTKQVKKTAAVDFQATGKREVGEKATGTMELTRTSVSSTPITIPVGTSFTGGDLTFVSVEAATLTGTGIGPGGIVQDSATVRVQAVAIGEEYNVAARSYGSNVGGFDAVGSAMTGGSKKQITVVSADDIVKATQQLKTIDSNVVKLELSKQFTKDEIVVDESFMVEPAAAVSTPAVDQEASAAKLTAETTYTLLGMKRAELKAVYAEYLKTQLKGDSSQKVYETGDATTQFSQFQKIEGGYTVRATANAQVGPNIDSDKLASDAKGKRSGEVQQEISAIQGVEDVKVTLSPFWVTRVPNDLDRITITFTLTNDK